MVWDVFIVPFSRGFLTVFLLQTCDTPVHSCILGSNGSKRFITKQAVQYVLTQNRLTIKMPQSRLFTFNGFFNRFMKTFSR
jgi:hypothetical protein